MHKEKEQPYDKFVLLLFSFVKARIDSVQQLGSVVDITKTLFEVSKVRGNGASNIPSANE